MRTARLEDGELRIMERPDLEPGYEDAVVRITASGVCHSDLHLARGDWYGMQPPSLGHEAIGIVEELGPGADRFVKVGDRVIVGLGGSGGGFWCGACEFCLRGQPRLCAQTQNVMGTFAEQFVTYAPGLVTLPDSIPDSEAPLACGGLTAYGAVKKVLAHGVLPGRTVAVIGAAGGLGHYAVQLLTAFGFRVVGVDIGEQRLDFVRSLGAELAIEPDAAVEAVQRDYGGVQAVLVFSARIAGYELGLQLLGKGGLFVGVGLPPTSEGGFSIDVFRLFAIEPTIMFSAVGNVQDMRELVDLAAAGKVRTHVDRTGPLSDLDAIFEELETGKFLGRAVITDLAH
jgi:propanol-preferring alcohol dehydrogenase